MYTNTVVRCCTDVFLVDSLHVLLTVHLLNYGLHCQNKMHRKSKWMIYHWGSIFILWTNKRFASCKTYDSNHFKYDVRSLKRAMCDMRCAICVHFNECARRIITNFSTVFQKPWTIFYSRNYFVRFRALALLLTKLSTRSE